MTRVNPDELQQRWVHSHEEDEPGRMVFRTDAWHFPPSRGRRAYDLKPGGTLVASGPGPTDRTVADTGQWRLLGEDVLEFDREGAPSRRKILEAGPDRLVLAK